MSIMYQAISTRCHLRWLLICLLSAVLSACGGRAGAPVINKSPFRQIPAERIVAPGDSIYSISWEYGLDFLDIAGWNDLKPPYALKAGQSIGLRPGARVAVLKPAAETEQIKSTSLDGGTALPATPKVAAPSAAPSSATIKSTPSPATKTKPPLPSGPPAKWLWPAKGKLIARYSRKNGVNGIRIAAGAGTPVVATASGDVVYVGEGIRGYGKLIIVKHSEQYLSAYAHNRRIVIAEGDRIKAGQKIGEMGSNGAGQTMLHFEIRVNGKPKDPLQYLGT